VHSACARDVKQALTEVAMRGFLLACCALVVTGCTVGPDFRSPEPPAVDRYVPDPPPVTSGAPLLVPDAAPPTKWWTTFGSATLDELVGRALRNSPTLDQARARVAQAQELYDARAGGARFPRVDLTAGAERQRVDPATVGFPQAPNPGPFNVFSLGATVRYDFDIFGGTRRDLEGLAAQVDYHGYELHAARLTLAGSVVAVVVQRATSAAELEATQSILDVQRHTLAVTEERYRLGGVAWVEVQNQRALVAQTEAGMPPLRADVATAGHRLAVLMGEPPGTANVPLVRLADLRVPAQIPLRVPAELVRTRPDIRASEALLHKASADVGVATADLYPKLVISGGFSTSQLALADLFGNGINLWSIGINLAQPLLRGGELQARKRAAEAAYGQALAAYRQTVLQSFANVADILRELESATQALAARSEQAARAEDAWRITLERYRLGGASELALLDAERQRLAAEVARIGTEGARLASVGALWQAMGVVPPDVGAGSTAATRR